MATGDAVAGRNGYLEPAKSEHLRATSPAPMRGGIVVLSGGSAANSLVDVFDEVREAKKTTLSYVIPISDNGGSSSELIRVFGGPGERHATMSKNYVDKPYCAGIGDVRSRLVRLIPDAGEEALAIKGFFNHRLPKDYAAAKSEWLDIVEANHTLWHGISPPKQELIRSFLNVTNLEVVKRLRPTSRFDWSGASIGNLFLTGARLFTGSFEAAVYLLSSICAVPGHVVILPALNSNFACHIAAGLADGTVITGQNNISHPSHPSAAVPAALASSPSSGLAPQSPTHRLRNETEEQDKVEDAYLPGTLPTLRKPAIAFSKDHEEDLPSHIERLWYINPYGQEIRLPANPRVVDSLKDAGCVIYSIGSLFTSIVPTLVLRDVGNAIASPAVRSKILLLNGTLDRETGPSFDPYTAIDFVAAIANACADSRSLPEPTPDEYSEYVTHVIYIESSSGPTVDRDTFNKIGIETMRLYGRKDENGKGGRYDHKALEQALCAIVGRKDPRGEKTRRATLVS